MESNHSFRDLLRRVRQRDDEASTLLVSMYENEVRRFVRYRLNSQKLRRFLDSLDVCQSVFAKFFVRVSAGDFDLKDPKQLQQLLLTMANNKLLDHYRKGAAQRRGGGKADMTGQTAKWIADPAANPADALEARELVDLVRGRLSSDEQSLLDQWMQGEDWPVIAARTGASAEAVRKRFTRAVDRAAAELGWQEREP
jgi:RNA polymerase sigma factor (sigma-70 family)